MSGGKRLWWEEVTSRVLGSVSWDEMKRLGDIQLSNPWGDDADRLWRVSINAMKLSEEMVGFWGGQLCGASPMELYIFGRNDEGLPSGIWILQKMSQVFTEGVRDSTAWTIEFVQDEKLLAMPIRWEG